MNVRGWLVCCLRYVLFSFCLGCSIPFFGCAAVSQRLFLLPSFFSLLSCSPLFGRCFFGPRLCIDALLLSLYRCFRFLVRMVASFALPSAHRFRFVLWRSLPRLFSSLSRCLIGAFCSLVVPIWFLIASLVIFIAVLARFLLRTVASFALPSANRFRFILWRSLSIIFFYLFRCFFCASTSHADPTCSSLLLWLSSLPFLSFFLTWLVPFGPCRIFFPILFIFQADSPLVPLLRMANDFLLAASFRFLVPGTFSSQLVWFDWFLFRFSSRFSTRFALHSLFSFPATFSFHLPLGFFFFGSASTVVDWFIVGFSWLPSSFLIAASLVPLTFSLDFFLGAIFACCSLLPTYLPYASCPIMLIFIVILNI